MGANNHLKSSEMNLAKIMDYRDEIVKVVD